jgi:hypothetical protein
MMRAGTFGAPLVVHKKKTETLVTIPAKSVFTPHKSLGHYKAPAGTNHTQLNILHTNSDKCAKLVSSSPCNRMDSWYFYTAIYLKSIGYVLADCFFLAKELKQVQQAVLHAFLAKCGYNCNTHQLIVYAPIGHGGCRLTPLYLMQGEGQILTFLKNWRTDTEAGRLLQIAVSWNQLHLGTSSCFLQDITSSLPHMPGRWLKSLRHFLAHINGSFELDNSFLPPPQQQHDKYIMDLVLKSAAFSDPEIKQINYCRLYLKAITLSDTCNADGSTLDCSMLTGSPSTTSSKSAWIHIHHACPNATSWNLWQKACSLWSMNNTLRHPLGDWLKPASLL